MNNKNFLYNMKINFDINYIKLRTLNKTDFIEGIEYFNNNYVKNITLFKSFNNESLEDVIKVKATINDNTNTSSNVEVIIDSNGDIINHSCSKSTNSNYKLYFCKNVVAVLLYIYNKNKVNLKQNQIIDSILEADCLNIIETYDKIIINESRITNNDYILSLSPKLHLNNNYLEISFNICNNNKSYVIKNLYEFIKNVESSSDFQYGKNFIVNHSIHNFDNISKQLINFISKLIYEYYDYINIYKYENTYNSIIKFIRIPNSKLETLFYILKDEPINLSYNNNISTVKVIYNNPITEFELFKNKINNKYEFTINNNILNNLHLITSTNNLYAINDKNIYVCDKNYLNKIFPLITKLKNTVNSSFYISNNNIYKFINTVITNIKNIVGVKISDDIKNTFKDYPIKKQLFIDANKKNNIVMNVFFKYNDININYFEKSNFDNKNIIRNLYEEYEIISLIESFGFVEKNEKFIMTKENDIYNFISDNINKLIEISEVNVSEKFKKIKYSTPKNISMGVKLVNNLIEIDLQNLEFSFDELKDIIKNYDIKKKYYRLKDGSFINLNYDYFKSIEDLNNDLDLQNAKHLENKIYIPKYRSLAINNIVKNNYNIITKSNSAYDKMVNNLLTNKDINYKIPKNIDNVLRSYQRTGFKWLKTISTFGLGGILADDMGLGKTIQIISLLLDDDININRPSIVICPSSLIYNWLKEVEKFAPTINTITLVGNKQQRLTMIKKIKDVNLVITSYDLLKRDIDLYEEINFNYCILDEAQYIKNSYTQNAESVKQINSNVRFALTGTPIENSLSDLWSIFDFIMPNFLLNYNKFKNTYENPIIKNNNKDILHKLHKTIEPFVLRRLKKDVLKDLPDKIVTLSYTEMHETQKKLYLSELIKINEEFQQEIQTDGFNKNKIIMLALLTRLRQICCHPSLFLENYNGESAKLNQCMQIVKNCIESNHKIIIFSQFTTMLEIISNELDSNDISYYTLTGKTKVNDRITLIDKFNNDDTSVFLISLKAGGTGLNLTGADIVIHFDPWWNNSVENQATDRTHRIGQKNKVQVYKMIVKDTIEEKIQLLQNKKQHLCDSIITEKEVFINSLTKEDIKTLFEIK